MIEEIKGKLTKALAHYVSVRNDPVKARSASKNVRALQALLSSAIADGAAPCKYCGKPAHGMEQPKVVGRGKVVTVYEIGCSDWCGKTKGQARILDGNREVAVANWNAMNRKE